jgi:hypothetical protein
MDSASWRIAFVVPLIVGLVELARRAGLGPVASSVLAVALGLAVRLAYEMVSGTMEPAAWIDAVLQGLTLGLAAAGWVSKLRQSADKRV